MSSKNNLMSSGWKPVDWTRDLGACVSLLCFVFLVIVPRVGVAQDQDVSTKPVTVMSFNLRYGTARDGENRWEKRTDLVAEAIRSQTPDLLGTQETLPFQAQFISDNFSEYASVGRSREPDNANGEQCALFYRRDRFDLLASGHFWLSENPDHPGTKSWDSSLPRMATWVRLWDQESQQPILFVNTHFDHRGKTARLESAQLVRKRATELASGAAVIITGDFNCGADSPPHQAMFETADSVVGLRDSYIVAHGTDTAGTGTFNGFEGKRDGPRIDWIALNDKWEVKRAEIIDYQQSQRYPSDHFPVVAEVQLVTPTR